MLFVCLRPQAGNKHSTSIICLLETTMFVEGKFFVVRDHDDAEVILVYFMDLVDEFPADAFALVFDAHLNFVSKLS